MSISRQSDPRANQKERTRVALVEAASRLLRQGTSPTVAEAAEAAKVSRATAYRYFPTQEALLVEIAQIGPATEPIEALLAGPAGDDVEERLLGLLDTFNPIVLNDEAHMRNSLRVYLATWFENRATGGDVAPVRAGRRMRWLDEVLEPLRDDLTGLQWRRLRCGLALTLGADAMVVMKDVCGLDDDEEILDALRWTATVVLRAVLDDAHPSSGEITPGPGQVA
jgi:AcrR family transcriptional regulator